MTFFALPPAEARLPLTALFRGLFPREPDFSEKLGEAVGSEVCGLANSARILFYLIFKALRSRADVEDGEILLPGYTCYSVAAAAVKAGCKVVLYDLVPSTFQPDFADVKDKITPRTLAVVGQHLLGVRADINRLTAISHDHGLCCVEDAAQYLRSSTAEATMAWKSDADFSVFSFGRGKPLPLGGGGALIDSGRGEFAGLIRDFDLPASTFSNWLLPFAVQILCRPHLYWFMESLPLGLGRTLYDPAFDILAMPPFYQRIGSASLSGLEKLNDHRADIGSVYQSFFLQQTTRVDRASMPAYVRYPLLVDNQQQVKSMTNYGVRQLYPLALCDLPDLQAEVVEVGRKTTGAREIARRLVTLPSHLAVDVHQAKEIARAVQRCFVGIETIQASNTASGNQFAATMPASVVCNGDQKYGK